MVKDKVYKILDKDTAKELRKIIITLYQYQNRDQNKTEYITKLTKKKRVERIIFYNYGYLSSKSKYEIDKILDKHIGKVLKRVYLIKLYQYQRL